MNPQKVTLREVSNYQDGEVRINVSLENLDPRTTSMDLQKLAEDSIHSHYGQRVLGLKKVNPVIEMDGNGDNAFNGSLEYLVKLCEELPITLDHNLLRGMKITETSRSDYEHRIISAEIEVDAFSPIGAFPRLLSGEIERKYGEEFAGGEIKNLKASDPDNGKKKITFDYIFYLRKETQKDLPKQVSGK